MMKKLILIIGLVFCATTAHAVENLIEISDYENLQPSDGVIHQLIADPREYLEWKVQAWYNTPKDSNGTLTDVLWLRGVVSNQIGFISLTFTTPTDLEDLKSFRFGLNGEARDSIILFDIKDVMPNTTYTIQWRLLNAIQGEIAWTDMLLVHCEDGYSLALGDENCSRECENKPVSGGHIPPDAARVYEPAICTYDQAHLVCDDGYGLHDGACAQLCTTGMQHIKTGNGLQFNLYQVAYSTPALHIKRNDTVCYGVLAPGAATNAININHNGQIYHTMD